MLYQLHNILVAHPWLHHIVRFFITIYLIPGNAMLLSLADTSWGRDWHVTAADWPLAAIFSLVFWCLLLSFISAANDRLRSFTRRNETRKAEDKWHHAE